MPIAPGRPADHNKDSVHPPPGLSRVYPVLQLGPRNGQHFSEDRSRLAALLVFGTFCLLYFSFSDRYVVVSPCSFNFDLPKDNEVERLWDTLLCEVPVEVFCPFFYWFGNFFIGVLYVLWIWVL